MGASSKKNLTKQSAAALIERGLTCHREGRAEAADRLYAEALARVPTHAKAWYLRSVVAMSDARYEQATAFLERAVQFEPTNAVFLCNLGEAYRRRGHIDAARATFLRATAANPALAEAHYNLGLTERYAGRPAEAVVSFERALALAPALPGLGEALVLAWSEAGQNDVAVATYERFRHVVLDTAGLRVAVANILVENFLLDAAMPHFERALALEPDNARAHSSYAVALADRGELDAAILHGRRAVELDPSDHVAHGNLLFALPYHPDFDAPRIRAAADAFARRHGTRVSPSGPHENDRDPSRRLRIGYVSPDFRQHSVAHFLLPLLRHHDPREVETFCYSNVRTPDALTEAFRAVAGTFRDIVALSDDAVAARIREDRIDVLVDLAMHTAGNRLMVFARKPAPVQLCYLAYLGTTGLPAMDYRMTDPRLESPGAGEMSTSERPLWLSDTYWCYDPLTTTPEVSPLPAALSGAVTFGSLNSFRKTSPGTLELWAGVLSAVPGSKMILHASSGVAVERVRAAFASHGVDPGRLEFVGRLTREKYLETYQRIDVCLDTIPFNGGTTTFDAYFMGVPVVSLLGKTVVGRAGHAIAHGLGLSDLVAANAAGYVAAAVRLCKDLVSLSALRGALRARLAESVLMDAPRFARSFERACRTSWTEWCAEEPNRAGLQAE